MTRFWPLMVSATGVVGLALGFVYLWLVFVAFQPGGGWATNLLVGPSDRDFRWTFLAFLVPYFLLVAHLYMRTQLGHWLLSRGAALEAIRYAGARLEVGVMRSRREVSSHRLALGKAYAYLGRYDEAWGALREGPGMGKRDRARVAHWRVEVALRLGRLRDVDDVLSGAQKLGPTGPDVAGFWGAVAESRGRTGDRRGFDEAYEKAKWADPNHARTRLCSVLFALWFDPTRSRAAAALEILDEIEDEIVETIPLRAGELAAWRAELLRILGETQEARSALEFVGACDRISVEALVVARLELAADTSAEE